MKKQPPTYLVINCPTAECPGNDCCSKGSECTHRAKINDARKTAYDELKGVR